MGEEQTPAAVQSLYLCHVLRGQGEVEDPEAKVVYHLLYREEKKKYEGVTGQTLL